jgi:hypothetical protein
MHQHNGNTERKQCRSRNLQTWSLSPQSRPVDWPWIHYVVFEPRALTWSKCGCQATYIGRILRLARFRSLEPRASLMLEAARQVISRECRCWRGFAAASLEFSRDCSHVMSTQRCQKKSISLPGMRRKYMLITWERAGAERPGAAP